MWTQKSVTTVRSVDCVRGAVEGGRGPWPCAMLRTGMFSNGLGRINDRMIFARLTPCKNIRLIVPVIAAGVDARFARALF